MSQTYLAVGKVRVRRLDTLLCGVLGAVLSTSLSVAGDCGGGALCAESEVPQQCFYLRTLWKGKDQVLTATNDGRLLLEERVEHSPSQVWYAEPQQQAKWVKLKVVAKPDEAVEFADAEEFIQPVMGKASDEESQMVKFLYNGRYEYIYTKAEGNRLAMDVVTDDQGSQPVLRERGNYAGQYWMRENTSCDQAERMLSAMQ